MALAEHPYYGSFGYRVSSFFACGSRLGTLDELESLFDQAHGLAMLVMMDLVHSHLHFLLSNCRFWMDGYCVDGFRFGRATRTLCLPARTAMVLEPGVARPP